MSERLTNDVVVSIQLLLSKTPVLLKSTKRVHFDIDVHWYLDVHVTRYPLWDNSVFVSKMLIYTYMFVRFRLNVIFLEHDDTLLTYNALEHVWYQSPMQSWVVVPCSDSILLGRGDNYVGDWYDTRTDSITCNHILILFMI